MRARTALIATLAVAVGATTTPAMAAVKKKPVVKLCNLLTDAKDDGTWDTTAAVKSPALDVQSADISTGPKTLVAVLRVGSTNTKSDNWANLGYIWNLGATAGGVRYAFQVRRGYGGLSQNTEASVSGVAVPHTFAVVGNTFVWTIDRAKVPQMARPKLVWGDFAANSNVMSSTADTSSSEKKYPDRAASCVVAK
jgi:hypothetical protein